MQLISDIAHTLPIKNRLGKLYTVFSEKFAFRKIGRRGSNEIQLGYSSVRLRVLQIMFSVGVHNILRMSSNFFSFLLGDDLPSKQVPSVI